MQSAIEHDELHDRFSAYLNDEDEEFADELRQNVEELDGVEKLKHTPTIDNVPVDDSTARSVRAIDLPPSLVFLDPWGYAGLSVDLFRAYLSNWGTDIIFFFNYNRINAALNNPTVEHHMDRMFGGTDATQSLRRELSETNSPDDRKTLITEAMNSALKDVGGDWRLSFEFRSTTSNRPSHFIFFASGSYLGFKIMKRVMSKRSSGRSDQRALFGLQREIQTNLLLDERPLGELRDSILERFQGQRLTRDKLVRLHQEETGNKHMFEEKHYNEVLRELEDEDRIEIYSTRESRRKHTYPDYVDIQFPDNEEQADE